MTLLPSPLVVRGLNVIIIIIIQIIILIIIIVYSEVHLLDGSSPSKITNYNTSIKTLKNISLRKTT